MILWSRLIRHLVEQRAKVPLLGKIDIRQLYHNIEPAVHRWCELCRLIHMRDQWRKAMPKQYPPFDVMDRLCEAAGINLRVHGSELGYKQWHDGKRVGRYQAEQKRKTKLTTGKVGRFWLHRPASSI